METSSSAIRIRLATTKDIPSLTHLIADSVRQLSVKYYSSVQIESALRNVFGVDTQLILDQTYFVAEAEGQIVGCGGWSKRNTLFGGDQVKDPTKLRDADALLVPGRDPARLRAFYVHPHWSRKGIGRQITQACESAALQAGFTRAELIATLPGQPLYAANGYEVVCPFQIPLPGDLSLPAFRMAKDLALKTPFATGLT